MNFYTRSCEWLFTLFLLSFRNIKMIDHNTILYPFDTSFQKISALTHAIINIIPFEGEGWEGNCGTNVLCYNFMNN